MENLATNDILRAFNPLRLAGPIFDKELRVASRRRRTYLLRFVYILGLMWFVAQVLGVSIAVSQTSSSVVQVSQAGQLAARAVTTIVWFEFILAQLLSIVLLSGSIGNEIRQRSLDVLLTTPINSLQIVLGKFAGGLLQLVLLLAVSLPLLAVVRVYGGVPWNSVVVCLCVILTTSLFTGALSLLMSAASRHAYLVMFTAATLCAILWAGSAAVVSLLRINDVISYTTARTAFYLTNPFYVMMTETEGIIRATSSGAAGTWWLTHCLIFLAATALMLLAAAYRVRRVASASVPSRKEVASHAAPATSGRRRLWSRGIRRVQGSPIVWKERRRPLYTRPRGVLGILGTILAVGLVIALLAVLIRGSRLNMGSVSFGLAVLLVILFVLDITVSAASAITREKEARTLTCLLTTPLSSGRIIKDKALGLFRRNLPLLLVAVILGLLAFVLLSPNENSAVGSIAISFVAVLLGDTVFLMGLGLCMSTHLKTAVPAIVATFVVYLGSKLVIGGALSGVFAALVASGILDHQQIWTQYVSTFVNVVVFGGAGLLLMRVAAGSLRRCCLR